MTVAPLLHDGVARHGRTAGQQHPGRLPATVHIHTLEHCNKQVVNISYLSLAAPHNPKVSCPRSPCVLTFPSVAPHSGARWSHDVLQGVFTWDLLSSYYQSNSNHQNTNGN